MRAFVENVAVCGILLYVTINMSLAIAIVALFRFVLYQHNYVYSSW